MNIVLPKTNVVGCVFSLRGSNTTAAVFDEYDFIKNRQGLKQYHYRVPEHLEGKLMVGDIVVVHCQTGYQLCQVSEINCLNAYGMDPDKLAPVVDVVNLGYYVESIEKAKALKAMKAAIDKEKKRLESLVTYELIAEKNPEFAELLKHYKEAGGEF